MNHARRIMRVNSDETFRYSKSFHRWHMSMILAFISEQKETLARDTISVFPIRI